MQGKVSKIYQGSTLIWDDEGTVDTHTLMVGNKALQAMYFGTLPWMPTTTNQLLWLDASSANNFVLDNDSHVEEWLDKSGNNNHFFATSPANRPEFIVHGGYNGVYLNGVDHWLDSLVTIADGLYSFYAVVELVSPGTTTYGGYSSSVIMAGRGGSDPTIFDANLIHWGGDEAFFFIGTPWEGGHHWLNGSDDVDIVPGKNTLSGVQSWGVEITSGDRNLIMGAHKDGDGNVVWFSHHRIHEVIVYNGQTTFEYAREMEGYLAHKWGIEDKLPSDHPFKTHLPSG